MKSRFWLTRCAALFALLPLPFCFMLELGAAQWGWATGSKVIVYIHQCQAYAVEVDTGRTAIFLPLLTCALALSPDGQLIAVEFRDQLFAAPFSKVSEMIPLTGDGIVARSPTWSPDGLQVAFWSLRSGGRVGELLIVNVNDGRLRSLGSFVPGSPPHLAWSPDGRLLAFSSYRDGDDEIYVIHVGTGELRQLTHNTLRDDDPSWSPDGRHLVFTSIEDGYNELHVLDIATAERYQLTRSVIGYVASWSPDGEQIAFMSNRYFRNEVYVINADGTDLRRLTYIQSNDGLYPIWLP